MELELNQNTWLAPLKWALTVDHRDILWRRWVPCADSTWAGVSRPSPLTLVAMWAGEIICYPPLTCESRPASPSAARLRLEWGESRDAVACAEERRAGQPLTGHQQYMLHFYIERIQNEASCSNVAIQLHLSILHHAHQCMLRSTSYYILYSQPWQHSTLIIHPTFFMLCSMLSITFIFFICNIYHHTKCLWGCYSSSKVYAQDTAFTV